MSKRLSVDEAQASLVEYIREVENGETVLITSDGEPVAALVRPEDLEALQRLREVGLAGLAGGWEGSDELVHHLETSSRVGQRDIVALDE